MTASAGGTVGVVATSLLDSNVMRSMLAPRRGEMTVAQMVALRQRLARRAAEEGKTFDEVVKAWCEEADA